MSVPIGWAIAILANGSCRARRFARPHRRGFQVVHEVNLHLEAVGVKGSILGFLDYQLYFIVANGPGPYTCYFCGVQVDARLVIHHKDGNGNHKNNAWSNWVAAHAFCHQSHHARTRPRRAGSFTAL